MILNNDVINSIKAYEGLKLAPYKDISGFPTIGYGNRFYQNGSSVKLSDKPLTIIEANELFNFHIEKFAGSVKDLLKFTPTIYQLGALTSLAYNLGITAFKKSSVLKTVNKNSLDFEAIENAFNQYVFSKSVKIQGLINRRISEFKLYQKKNSNLNIMQKLLAFYQLHKKQILIGLGVAFLLVLGCVMYKKYK